MCYVGTFGFDWQPDFLTPAFCSCRTSEAAWGLKQAKFLPPRRRPGLNSQIMAPLLSPAIAGIWELSHHLGDLPACLSLTLSLPLSFSLPTLPAAWINNKMTTSKMYFNRYVTKQNTAIECYSKVKEMDYQSRQSQMNSKCVLLSEKRIWNGYILPGIQSH